MLKKDYRSDGHSVTITLFLKYSKNFRFLKDFMFC